jgi:hypothetical protein
VIVSLCKFIHMDGGEDNSRFLGVLITQQTVVTYNYLFINRIACEPILTKSCIRICGSRISGSEEFCLLRYDSLQDIVSQKLELLILEVYATLYFELRYFSFLL